MSPALNDIIINIFKSATTTTTTITTIKTLVMIQRI